VKKKQERNDTAIPENFMGAKELDSYFQRTFFIG